MGAAMDPDHHWQLSRPRRAPDVQLEAILRLMLGYPARDKCGAHRLRTSRAEFCGIADAPPARRCLRRPPAKRSEEHTSEPQSLMRISYAVFCLQKKQQSGTHMHYGLMTRSIWSCMCTYTYHERQRQ